MAEVAAQKKVVVDSVFFRTVVDPRHIIAVGPATSAPNEPRASQGGLRTGGSSAASLAGPHAREGGACVARVPPRPLGNGPAPPPRFRYSV